MRTFLEKMAEHINSKKPGALLQLALNLIKSEDSDCWTKIEKIYASDIETVKFEMCQTVSLDFVQKLKPTLIEIILWHRQATTNEIADEYIIKVDDNVYPVFQKIYGSFGQANQMAHLARMIVDFYQQNPDRQDEIKALIIAQAEIDWFYGDPRSHGRTGDYKGSESEILSEIINITTLP